MTVLRLGEHDRDAEEVACTEIEIESESGAEVGFGIEIAEAGC